MTTGPNHGGTPGQVPGSPPPAGGNPNPQKAARRRIDRVYGITLLTVGAFATVMYMTSFTENALAQQFALLYEQYGLAEYVRPAGLATLSLIAIIGHPVIYAIALYLTLIVWRRGSIAAWIPLLGAILAFAFSVVIIAAGAFLHPDLVTAITMNPAGTPTPTP